MNMTEHTFINDITLSSSTTDDKQSANIDEFMLTEALGCIKCIDLNSDEYRGINAVKFVEYSSEAMADIANELMHSFSIECVYELAGVLRKTYQIVAEAYPNQYDLTYELYSKMIDFRNDNRRGNFHEMLEHIQTLHNAAGGMDHTDVHSDAITYHDTLSTHVDTVDVAFTEEAATAVNDMDVYEGSDADLSYDSDMMDTTDEDSMSDPIVEDPHPLGIPSDDDIDDDLRDALAGRMFGEATTDISCDSEPVHDKMCN